MWRIGVAVAVSILFLLMIAGDVYRFVYIDDGIRYFSENPGRFLLVGLIALVGGVATVVIVRLSPIAQRRLKIAVLSGFGVALAWTFIGLAWTLVTLDPVIAENLPRRLLVTACIAFLVLIGFVLFELRRVLRADRPVSDAAASPPRDLSRKH